jgi:hypothetical protein
MGVIAKHERRSVTQGFGRRSAIDTLRLGRHDPNEEAPRVRSTDMLIIVVGGGWLLQSFDNV